MIGQEIENRDKNIDKIQSTPKPIEVADRVINNVRGYFKVGQSLSNPINISFSNPPPIKRTSRSISLDIENSLPGGIIPSTIKSFPLESIAFLQFFRIVIHLSSGQSWRIWDNRYASLPSGISLKKSHSTALILFSSLFSFIILII